MAPSTRIPFIATRAAAWGLVGIVLGLASWLLWEPERALPLVAVALLAALAVVTILATTELDADLVATGLAGAFVGGIVEVYLLGQTWWRGALFGLAVGALIGDELQLAHKWLRLTRQAKAGERWWQRIPMQSRWLPRTVWVAFFSALVALVTMPWWLPYETGSTLTADLFSMFRERRLETSFWSNLSQVWFAVVPLSMAVALSRFAARVPFEALLLDGILRRIAVLQCAALLMLAANALAVWTILLGDLPAHSSAYGSQLASFVDMLRLALVPCLLLMLSQLFLGRRLFLYWQRSGWIVAVGGTGAVTVLMLGYLIVFTLERAA